MAEITTIARPYAEALYEVAESGDIDAWAELVNRMAGLAANPEMLRAIGNPRLTDEQLFDVFTSILGTTLSSDAQNLVHTLIANKRLGLLPEIAQQFHALKNEREGSADAQIFSAFAMSDEAVKQLVVDLEKKFKIRLRPSLTLDASLIGGVRVVIGDEVIDDSVRTRLEQMRVALSA